MKLYAGYNSGKRELAMGKVIKGSVFKYRIVMRGDTGYIKRYEPFLYKYTGFRIISIIR